VVLKKINGKTGLSINDIEYIIKKYNKGNTEKIIKANEKEAKNILLSSKIPVPRPFSSSYDYYL
jgi:hypothetical protein